MIGFKNAIVCSLAISTLLLGSSLSIHGCEAQNSAIKKTSGFRFEDYKDAKDAEKELLKLFPIGSDVKILVNKMESIKAKCLSDEKGASCEYIITRSVATGDSWSVDVSTEKNKITKIYVHKGLTSL
jgi:hypothetical protein